MRAYILVVALLAALSAPALPAAPAWSAQAEGLDLRNLVLDNQAGQITVRFGVQAPEAALVEAMSEGAGLGLTCRVDLERMRSVWPDATVAGAEYVSRLSRDELAQEYVLHLPGAEKPLRSKDLAPLLDKAWGAVAMDLGSWSLLAPGHDYALRLRISLKRLDVPAWLRYAVFFWSWDVLPETNYQQEFHY